MGWTAREGRRFRGRRMRAHRHHQAAQRGFSLLEALIAIVVLAFGLLSVVGVQLEALRGNQHAAHTSAAASLVKDYQEILLSMPSIALDPASPLGSVDRNTYAGFGGTGKDCKGEAAACTNQEFADFQVGEWLARVQAALPGGVASVCFDSAHTETSGDAKGLYRWECSHSGELLVVKIGWAMRIQRKADGRSAEAGIDDGQDRPRLVIPLTGNQAGYQL